MGVQSAMGFRSTIFFVVMCVIAVTVDAKLKNCDKSLPIQLKVSIPDKLSQNVHKPYPLKAMLRVSENLKAPLVMAVDIRKEFWAGFWGRVPCPQIPSCEIPLTEEMFKKNGYSFPPKIRVYHINTPVDLSKIPGYLLKGHYAIYVDIYSGKHRKHVGCVEGEINLNLKN